MSEMDRLVQDLSTSPDLQKALLAEKDGLGSAVAAAREAGYDITQDEAKAYIGSMLNEGGNELSDTQLDAVSGGKKRPNKFASLIGANEKAGDDPSFAINNLIGFYKDL